MDIVRATKGAQVEVQWNGERWGNNFLSSCFMWWKLYSHSYVIFSTKKFKMCALFLGHLYDAFNVLETGYSCHHSHDKWLRIALSSGPNWVGSFLPLHLTTKMDPVSKTIVIKYTQDNAQYPTKCSYNEISWY
jgi:hypothetical protein